MANQPADSTTRSNRAVIIAALIGGAATIIAGFGGVKVGTTATPAVTATTTVTATVTARVTVALQGDDSTPPTTNEPGAAGDVRWQGSVTLEETSSSSRTDLDLKPPTRAGDEADGDVYNSCCMVSDSGIVSANSGSSLVAKWTGDGLPDFNQCRETALAQGGDQVPNVKRGWILCVKTGEDRIARLEVVEVVGFSSIRADTVVWEKE